MSTTRHRVLVGDLHAGAVTLTDETAHYLRSVLRLGPGDEVALFDGKGQEAIGRLTKVERDVVYLEVSAPTVQPPARCRLTVALPAPKGERADWVVEKLAEIGVSEILWITCARSVVSPRPAGRRQERWRRLARAAARQSGRADLLALAGPVPFADLLERAAGLRLIADPGGSPLTPVLTAEPPASAILAVGPEGGFADHELENALDAGYTAVRLGRWTLRIETAAVVGAGILLGT